MKTEISVAKCNYLGEEVVRYPARVLEESDGRLVVEARFRPESVQAGSLLLQTGDRFVETYFLRRWYNIFAVYGGENKTLKGWYCNISYPPEVGRGLISYRDLALDLVITPDGHQELLDEDEFRALALSAADRASALAALDELRARFTQQFEE